MRRVSTAQIVVINLFAFSMILHAGIARADPTCIDWSQRSPATSPSPRYGQQMVFDSSRGVCVLFGGYNHLTGPNSQTWEWDGSNWNQRTPAAQPFARYWYGMAYDTGRGVTVLFGGYSAGVNGQTWEWNGTNWIQLFPPISAPKRAGHALAYDQARGVTVLFGGSDNSNGSIYNDTWEWNGTTWTQRSPSTSPSPRFSHSMAYDPNRQVIVLFGGVNLGDTWEWDGSNWLQRNPVHSPTFRSDDAIAFDSGRGVIVLFGGQYYSGGPHYLAETWQWDGTDWTQIHTAHSPSPRYDFGMAYDSTRDTMVVMGGSGQSNEVSDTWELSAVTPPCVLDADLDCGGRGDGSDIQEFVNAILTNSTAPFDLCHADFDGNGVIDVGDIPGFSQKLLGI